ncbi:hypothetical protein [Maridesulfovibrio sp.]|uniref:hypothetical protein n=1 Tax=Maridesulfovibrio sp. TaxID=2795000 RepID=UPI002A18B25A|nr:hypothetical protein [Maridesulfovibrio sp.]
MTVLSVRIEGRSFVVGNRDRKMLTRDGCNEPFKDRFWCPRKKWFMKSPCPFINKQECGNYRNMCGSL